ncbi:MAG: hypothetical protein IJ489_05425 [Clostridia bacterium]|nr:hypothetical protein [Clostridia bacterium]
MNSLFSIFTSNSSKKEDAETEMTHHHGDYTVNKNRRVDIAIGVFAAICAIIIWVYAVTVGDTTKEFQNIPVTVKRVSIVSTQGYDVQYSDLRVNFKIQGSGSAVSQISENSVEVYVDLSTINLTEITDMKVVELPLVFNVPGDVRCLEKSQEYIKVTITKIVHNGQS